MLSSIDMDAREFLKTFGPEEAEAVCKRAGTNMAYFRQLAGGFRSPSAKLARRLAEESANRMDEMSLLYPPESAKDMPVEQRA